MIPQKNSAQANDALTAAGTEQEGFQSDVAQANVSAADNNTEKAPWEEAGYNPIDIPSGAQKSVASLVCNKNSHRLAIARTTWVDIGSPEKVQVAISGKKLMIGIDVPGANNEYDLKKDNRNTGRIMYGKPLAEMVLAASGVELGEKTSVSFNRLTIMLNKGNPVAIIDMAYNSLN
jgi:hypothetical protein